MRGFFLTIDISMEPDDERAIGRALAAVLAAAERLDVRALNDLVSAVREPRALDVRHKYICS